MTNPGNIVRIRSRNAGRASVYEANMWAQTFSTGLLGGNGVLQNTSANMNVLVGGSPSKPDVVIAKNPAGYNIALDIIGQQAIQITPPASNSRIASIVVYTNDLALASTDTATTGSPSSCGLIVVYGSASATPTPPTEATIRSAITADGATGSQAVYGVIADIPVASSTTTITNAIISSKKAGVIASALGFKTLRHLGVSTKVTLNTVISESFATYASITAETTGGKLVIDYKTDIRDSGSGATRTGAVRVIIDGSIVPGSQITYWTQNNQKDTPGLTISADVPAGNHTISLQLSADTASATYLNQASLTVNEVVGI